MSLGYICLCIVRILLTVFSESTDVDVWLVGAVGVRIIIIQNSGKNYEELIQKLTLIVNLVHSSKTSDHSGMF
jgi:hypothetical protein